MTDDYAEKHIAGHRLLYTQQDVLTSEQLTRLLDQHTAAYRAQLAPLHRPSLWERLKRWWYSR